MNSFPFTSQDGDRKVKTSDFRELFKKYFTNGVFNGTFNVVQSTGMKVILKKGWCNIEGCFGWIDEDIELTIDYVSQETTHNIVLRLDDNRDVRTINAYVVKGNPNEVEPTRTQTVYELVVARIKTNVTTTSIQQSMIEDTRLDTNLCGIVSSTVETIDTTTFYEQIQGDLQEFKDNEQASFDEWFETIKNQLGTDVAGNLQLQIDKTNEKLDETHEATFNGGVKVVSSQYSGSASDYGIEIGKASGAYEQEGTPTPESPIEPKFFEPKHIISSGNNLYLLDNFADLNSNFTIDDDGWFSVNYTNNTGGDEFFNIYHKPIKELKKNSNYYFTIELEKNIFSGSPTLYINSLEVGSSNSTQFKNGDTTFRFDSDNKTVLLTTKESFDSSQYLLRTYLYISNGSSIDFKFRITLSPIENASFETYKPIYTIPLSLILRALPNGVKDTYENGVVTRRIKEIAFDGSEDEDWRNFANIGDTNRFRIELTKDLSATSANGICNKLPFEANYTIDKEHFYTQTNNIFIFLNKEKANSMEGLKTWLQSNPITIWYELAEPTTEQVDLPIIPSYFPYTNAWHDSDVEASDLTWNILTQSKSNENKINDLQDEMDVVNKRFQVRQLLVNPDFQINQREQSSYTESLKYTVDMWKIYLAKVDVLLNGVRVTSTNSSQKGFFTQLIDRINGEHTISLKANNKVHSFSFTPSGQQQRFRGDVFNVFVWNQDGKQTTEISIEVDIGNSVEIEYINLFEGDIVYPHVKESYQDDLMECQLIVKPLDTVGVVTYEYGQTANQYYYTFDVAFEEMIGKPTISNINAMYFSENGTPTFITPTVNGITKNNVKFQTPRGARKNIYSNGINVSCLLSCEPL